MNTILAFLIPFLEEWPLITAFVIVAVAGFSVFYSFLKKERVFLQREIEHVKDSMNQKIEGLGKEIGHVKELLSNHVTDTNKKIDKLETGMKEDVRELKAGQAKLEGKIDKIIDKLLERP